MVTGEERKITVFVDIGSMPGEVKTYQVEISSRYGSHGSKTWHNIIKKDDLIDSLRAAGVKLTEGKYEVKDYVHKGEIKLYRRRDLPEHIFFRIEIELKS